MKFDLHTHHDRCGHAVENIRGYIDAAISKGLDIIGISDHSPYFAHELEHPVPGVAMAKSEFANYMDELIQLKKEYRHKIEVLIGVESDFFPEHYKLYGQIYKQYPIDYIIGSVHQMGGSSIFNKLRWQGLSEAEFLQEKVSYYSLIQQSARCGMFDILGHIDAVKKECPTISDIYTDQVEQTIKIISECDVAIEVNTSGKLFPCKGWFPSEDILELAFFHGVKVTFGSDAHNPNRVGDEFEQVKKKLKDIGYNEWAIFRNRKREMIAL